LQLKFGDFFAKLKWMENISDLNLIQRYLKGDQAALEALIKVYLKPVYGFIFHYIKDRAEAEDLTQEVFVKMWRNLKKFDQAKSFKTWLFTIARNSALDWLKKKKAIPFSEFENENGDNVLLDTLKDSRPSPLELLEQKGLVNRINCALHKLSAQYRLIMQLYYNESLNFREIAEFLSESVDTVKSRHRRALIALKKFINQCE